MKKETLNAVTLRRVRYDDRRSVFTCWTRERGRVSLMVADGGSTHKGSRLRALTMVPSVVECVATSMPGRDMLTGSGFRTPAPLPRLHSEPVRALTAQFVAEVLGMMLGQSEPDEAVWLFILETLEAIECNDPDSLANLPVLFLYRLAAVLGIEPDASTYAEGRFFDLRDGTYRALPLPGSRLLDAETSKGLALLSRLDYRSLHHLCLSRQQRRKAVDASLEYLSAHLAPASSLRSLNVLRSLADI